MGFEEEKDVALYAVREAVKIIAGFKAAKARLKKDKTLQTTADIASKDCFHAVLGRYFPYDAILTEEDKGNDRGRFSKRRCWVIDPLDGTKNFSGKAGDYGIILGLLEDYRPVVGVTYNILRGEVAYAVRGEGAYLQKQGKRRWDQLSVSEDNKIVLMRPRSDPSDELSKIISELELDAADQVPMGSSLKMIEVAKGDLRRRELKRPPATLYIAPRDREMHIWDYCGSSLILQEAGGMVTDIYGDHLDFSTRDTSNRGGLVASNGRIHKSVLEAVKRVIY